MVEHLPIVGGIALLENELGHTAEIHAVPADHIALEPEKALLRRAREMGPRLPFTELDGLIIDEMGKNISGTGMDTHVIGRALMPSIPEHEWGGPNIRIVAVLDLTKENVLERHCRWYRPSHHTQTNRKDRLSCLYEYAYQRRGRHPESATAVDSSDRRRLCENCHWRVRKSESRRRAARPNPQHDGYTISGNHGGASGRSTPQSETARGRSLQSILSTSVKLFVPTEQYCRSRSVLIGV